MRPHCCCCRENPKSTEPRRTDVKDASGAPVRFVLEHLLSTSWILLHAGGWAWSPWPHPLGTSIFVKKIKRNKKQTLAQRVGAPPFSVLHSIPLCKCTMVF